MTRSRLRPPRRLRTALGARARSDDGQLTLLVLGMAVIIMTLVAGAVAVTSVQISRMHLLDAADAAALDAVDEGGDELYDGAIGRSVPVTEAAVAAAAQETLATRARPAGLLSWQVAPGTGALDGSTAVVALTGEADLPLVGGLLRELGGSVTISVESRARADIDQPGGTP
ncbi:hypothetical protein GCM10022199_14870 [Marihabitans asiaticum]|uniref:Putative Flp pilus-assembly TadE/G-like protein n=1 Tax=Marihabitans asiaticum TaxID=415218 RepID=A0A560W8A6_9MICO|nr:pilus assembly protein TadG-related protein [Marihabitans asiaticum]TWD13820.1 putative Flp pilus-assembly TadE/G-like protein [Marihabitans asiaticum]